MEYEEIDDLKFIKKYYGEKMSHLCRDLFPSVLEHPGLLYHLLTTHFNPSKSLYYDIAKENKERNFKDYIYCFVEVTESKTSTTNTVKELLDSVGYDIYECRTNEDIQKFRKYYNNNEALCTFRDPNRIKNHRIFFIVKKNVDEIKREDFKNPQREDDYSTSVLDLQFDKGMQQRVSIKSRYNHTVNNPDATYSNNLDRIVPGLTEAFEREYGFNIGFEYATGFELDHYVKARDGKFYKYNYEIGNIHYCPDNIIIKDGEVVDKYRDKGRYTVFDYFVLDEKEKRMFIYSNYDYIIEDSFIDAFQNITNINIYNREGYREIEITTDNEYKAIIKIDKENRIIGYKNDSITSVGERFLHRNLSLKELDLPSLEYCAEDFLIYNEELEELSLPNLRNCGDDFLRFNEKINSIYLPKLESCLYSFLRHNKNIKEINLPSLVSCGSCFLLINKQIEKVELPLLKYCNNDFLASNDILSSLFLPSLESCGYEFLWNNKSLLVLDLPKLKRCGDDFLPHCESLEKINLPLLSEYGNNFINLCPREIKDEILERSQLIM